MIKLLSTGFKLLIHKLIPMQVWKGQKPLTALTSVNDSCPPSPAPWQVLVGKIKIKNYFQKEYPRKTSYHLWILVLSLRICIAHLSSGQASSLLSIMAKQERALETKGLVEQEDTKTAQIGPALISQGHQSRNCLIYQDK